MKRFIVWSLAALVGAPVPARAQGFLDHLKCHKARDPVRVAATADLLAALQPAFSDGGCVISRPRYYCVPVTTTNVQPAPPRPDIVGRPLGDDYVCYRARCPSLPPPQEVADQFGTRTQTAYRTSLVCVPARQGNDADRDGAPNDIDNCTLVMNASQCDADGDGYGNHCDCDFDQNGIGGFSDFNVFSACFGQTVPGSGPPDDPTCAESDVNCDGTVDDADFTLVNACFGKAPGPAAPCAARGGDGDQDGVCQDVDNCPDVANVGQDDGDGDGIGDACDV